MIILGTAFAASNLAFKTGFITAWDVWYGGDVSPLVHDGDGHDGGVELFWGEAKGFEGFLCCFPFRDFCFGADGGVGDSIWDGASLDGCNSGYYCLSGVLVVVWWDGGMDKGDDKVGAYIAISEFGRNLVDVFFLAERVL